MLNELKPLIHACNTYHPSIKIHSNSFWSFAELFQERICVLLDLVSELDVFVYFWRCNAASHTNFHVRGLFNDENELIAKIASDFHHVKGDKFDGMSTKEFYVNQIRFKCSHLLIEVLHRIPSPREMTIANMINYCVSNSRINLDEKAQEFLTQYISDNAITWYSSRRFFKKHFDRDLRKTDFNLISNFSFFSSRSL
jgi:hypothetical protein